jgi:hypothetical protein
MGLLVPLGTIRKPSMSKGAQIWFHKAWTYSGEVMEYWTIFSVKIHSNQNCKIRMEFGHSLGNVEKTWTEVSWWQTYYTTTMLKNHRDVGALISLTDDCQLRFKMFDQRGSFNRLISSCNLHDHSVRTWLFEDTATNPNFWLAHKLSMIYLSHLWSCFEFGLRASPPTSSIWAFIGLTTIDIKC